MINLGFYIDRKISINKNTSAYKILRNIPKEDIFKPIECSYFTAKGAYVDKSEDVINILNQIGFETESKKGIVRVKRILARERFHTMKQIVDFCKVHQIRNYTVNSDFSIDVDGSVNVTDDIIQCLPVKFNRVSGEFIITGTFLQTLDGCPEYVGSSFICRNNQLISLEGCPEYVGDDFDCSFNKIKNLHHSPERINRTFNCSDNEIESLKFGPSYIHHSLVCGDNPIQNFNDAPIYVGSHIYCRKIKADSIVGLPINQNFVYADGNLYNNYLMWKKRNAEINSILS